MVFDALKDDFNTPKALSYLFDIFKTMQRKLDENDESVVADYIGVKEAYKILGLFVNDTQQVINFIESHSKSQLPQEIVLLAQKRWEAKQNRDFQTADKIRNELYEQGYKISDSKDGYTIEKL